ncbi:MAG: NUDIX hydrolase [Hyphomicrobiales bacterium]
MTDGTLPEHFSRRVPTGDSMERDVCDRCGFVAYRNPKVVTGSVVRHEGAILLCRRAIEPRRGFWTLPAGYMELGETVEDAARREAQEEAKADVALERLLAVYSIPRIAQVQVMFLGSFARPGFAAGPESLEVRLFPWDDIPWGDLAFPSVRWALTQARSVEGQAAFVPFTNPPGERGD